MPNGTQSIPCLLLTCGKTSSRLLSSLLNSMGFVDERLLHMRTQRGEKKNQNRMEGCSCEWGWTRVCRGGRNGWMQPLPALFCLLKRLIEVAFLVAQMCKNADFPRLVAISIFLHFFLLPHHGPSSLLPSPLPSHFDPAHPL